MDFHVRTQVNGLGEFSLAYLTSVSHLLSMGHQVSPQAADLTKCTLTNVAWVRFGFCVARLVLLQTKGTAELFLAHITFERFYSWEIISFNQCWPFTENCQNLFRTLFLLSLITKMSCKKTSRCDYWQLYVLATRTELFVKDHYTLSEVRRTLVTLQLCPMLPEMFLEGLERVQRWAIIELLLKSKLHPDDLSGGPATDTQTRKQQVNVCR